MGLLPKSALNKMDWMYNEDYSKINTNLAEEYLLGKKIEDQVILKKLQIIDDNNLNAKNNDFLLNKEDPMY